MLSKNINASTLSAKDLWVISNGGEITKSSLKEVYRNLRVLIFFIFAFATGAGFMYVYSTFSHEAAAAEVIIKPTSLATSAILIPQKPEFSRENLMAEIIAQGIICPNVVYAQAELESSFLTAGSSVKTNNLFGMRYPGVRNTAAIGIYLQGMDTIIYGTRKELRSFLKRPTYAVYAHWTDAVKDYKMWQDYSFKTRTKYIEFLSRVYATEPTYAARISEMVSHKK